MAQTLDKSKAPVLKGTMTTTGQTSEPVRIEQLPPELMSIAAQGGMTPEDIGVGQTVYGGLGYGMGQSMDPLTQLAIQARQAETDAQNQYQQAQATPAAQTSPYADLLQSVMGNLASVVGRTPEPFKQAMEGIKSERAALETQRVETLKRLSQVVDERSKAAREAGNAEAEEKSLQQKDRIEKTLEAMLKNKADREEAARRAAEASGKDKDKWVSYVGSIRDDYARDSKPYNIIKGVYSELESLLAQPAKERKGPTDEAIIRKMAKIIDIMTGIREQERDSWVDALGVVQRFTNMPNQFINGKRLTREGEEYFRRQMEIFYQVAENNYLNNVYSMYRNQASQVYGVPDDRLDFVAPDLSKEMRLARQRFRESPAGRMLSSSGRRSGQGLAYNPIVDAALLDENAVIAKVNAMAPGTTMFRGAQGAPYPSPEPPRVNMNAVGKYGNTTIPLNKGRIGLRDEMGNVVAYSKKTGKVAWLTPAEQIDPATKAEWSTTPLRRR